MTTLLSTLDKMQEVLVSLTTLMVEEQEQLSAGVINSNQLQRITEDKKALLGTLTWLDDTRRTAETEAGLQAPYHSQPDLAHRWHSLQQHTQRLRNSNAHNGMLLQHQVRYTEQALSLLRPHQSQSFYGPDGLGCGQSRFSQKA